MAALCMACAGAAVAGTTSAAQDTSVREAHKAWRERDAARLAAAAAALRTHVLAPYVEYWQVMLAPEDRTIRQFTERHRGSHLAERLREDWVRGIAKRGDWPLLVSVASAIEQPDADIACWTLRGRMARGDASAAQTLMRESWLQDRDLPEGCAAAAREMAAAGRLDSAAVWARARRLVGLNEAAAARRTLALLPSAQAPSPRQLDLALGTPQRWLDGPAPNPRSALDRELSAMAIARMAGTDPLRAVTLLHQHRDRLDVPQRAYVQAQIGLHAARRLHDDAPAWFALARGADLSDEHRAWWVRAALRSRRWGDVRVAIAGMSPAARAEARWQYWLGRASQALGDARGAQALWSAAAREHGFYGRLAQEALGVAGAPATPAAPTRQELDAVARDPAVRRAVALHRADLPEEAGAEWLWAMRHLSDRQLLAAARYAQQLGLWSRALDSAERTRVQHDLSARYPTPFLDIVRPTAQRLGVDEALVYGVMHRESRFGTDASSNAGARGLMQLMPRTAQWLATDMGWRDYQVGWLDEPKHNIPLGVRYLRRLTSDLGGSAVLAVAGYNAGPGRATQWRAAHALEGAVYAESIPFEETRNYVQHVLAASLHYGERLNRAPLQLAAWLGTVPPGRAAVAPPVIQAGAAAAAGNPRATLPSAALANRR
jgi:soluble lytic murein transglycosylase